jgi:pyruvate formate lyase activating enzyme
MDCADACHAVGVHAVAVTAGYIHAEPRRELYAKMDAANVDLKAFTEEFYWKTCAAHLEPVKDTLRYLVRETQVWTEITTLIIPGLNDSDAELTALSEFVAGDLGLDVPLHFSAFHPDYKLVDRPATPPATLRRARDLARRAGLRHVYVGNVHDREADATYCPGCGAAVIERDWYEILGSRLEGDRCTGCGTQIAGRFGSAVGNHGRSRVRIRLARSS